MTVYAMTGSSGYIASRVIERLSQRPDCQRIIGLDVVAPRHRFERFEHRHLDVRDPSLKDLLIKERVDTLVHLAYVLNPTHTRGLEHDVNIHGTENVLAAAAGAGIPQILITSSTSAYGALPDNPPRLKEDMPLRAGPDFQYAKDKRELDYLCQEFAGRHPEMTVCIVRPCIVMGPGLDNFISRGLMMFMNVITDKQNPEFQFVHEDDVARGLEVMLEKRASGIYNLVGRGTLTLEEIYALKNRGIRLQFPSWLVYPIGTVQWAFRMAPFPPATVDFFTYPWVADGSKAEKELGFVSEHTTVDIWTSYLAYIERNPVPFFFRPSLKLKK